MTRHLNLALLICDTPLPEVVAAHGTYLEIFQTHLQKSLQSALRAMGKSPESVQFSLDGYDVVKGIYPEDEKLFGYDGIVITGSGETIAALIDLYSQDLCVLCHETAASAYAPSSWIPPLLDFVARVTKDFPNIRILGICFGHQIVARALGGVCVASEQGWEVGVFDVQLNSLGSEVFGQRELRVQQMHRDHVPATSIPPNFQIIGSTPGCENQGMVLRYPGSSNLDGLQGIHILTIQGHPEFHESIVSKVIDARELSGVMSPAVVADGRERAARQHDGIEVVGRVMWGILGVN